MEQQTDSPNGSSSSSSSSYKKNTVEDVEAVDLLEDLWFFENPLHRKSRMSKFQSNGFLGQGNLLRTPSLPSYLEMGKEEEEDDGEGKESKITKLTRQFSEQNMIQTGSSMEKKEGDSGNKRNDSIRKSSRSLIRTPSLPPCLGREKVSEEQESFPGFGKSTHPNSHSEFFQTRYKGRMAQSFNIPRSKPPKSLMQKARKGETDLEHEEVQGFKDLGFTFDKEDLNLNPNVVKILPGLKEKSPEKLKPNMVRRPYLSEAWLVQSPPPPPPIIPYCTKSAEDMKAQIKFWARAVAADVK